MLLFGIFTTGVVTYINTPAPAADDERPTLSKEVRSEDDLSRIVIVRFETSLAVRLLAVGASRERAERDPSVKVTGIPGNDVAFEGLPFDEARRLSEIFQRYSVQRVQASLSDAQLAQLRDRAKVEGRPEPNFRSWYRITLSADANRDAFIAALRELASVETAEPVGELSVPSFR